MAPLLGENWQDRLSTLLDYPESDEFGPVRPSSASLSRVTAVLLSLVERGLSLPDALDVGTDHDGAIRIVWENGPRFLELVADDAVAYLYYSHGAQYGIQRDLTFSALRQLFNWLDNAECKNHFPLSSTARTTGGGSQKRWTFPASSHTAQRLKTQSRT